MSFQRFRRHKSASFSTIDNTVTRDKNLSLKAKGLILTVMGLPENWDFSVQGMVSIVKEGKAAVYSAINELRASGYVKRCARYENGKIVEWVYEFYERPVDIDDDLLTDFQEIENLEIENLEIENRPQYKKQSIKETINQETSNARPRSGLSTRPPKTLYPLTTSSSELNIWLDGVAIAAGAGNFKLLAGRKRWEEICMELHRMDGSLEKLLIAIKEERERNKATPHFFSADSCLKRYHAIKTTKKTESDKWMHAV